MTDEAMVPGDRPRTVTLACYSMWVSLAVYILDIATGFLFATAIEFATFAAIVVAYGLLTMQISAGKNWARIAFLALYGLYMLRQIPGLFDMALIVFRLGYWSLALIPFALVGFMTCAAVLLCLGASSRWFLRSAATNAPVT